VQITHKKGGHILPYRLKKGIQQAGAQLQSVTLHGASKPRLTKPVYCGMQRTRAFCGSDRISRVCSRKGRTVLESRL